MGDLRMVAASTQENSLEGLLINKISKIISVFYNETYVMLIHILFINLINSSSQVNMKKLRISKKNPNKVLRTLGIDTQRKQTNQSIDAHPHSPPHESMKIKIKKSTLQVHPQIYSHRYQSSSPQQTERLHEKLNLTSKQKIMTSFQRDRPKQSIENNNRKNQHLDNTSPYLYSSRYSNNSANKFLITSSRRFDRDSSKPKQKSNSIRLSSLKRRSNSQELGNQSKNVDPLKQVKDLLVTGENNKCIIMLKRILKQDPNNVEGQYLLCLNYYRLGDYRKAIDLGQSLIECKVKMAQVYNILVRSYQQCKKDTESLQKLNEYEKLFPDDPKMLIDKAAYYHKSKQSQKAITTIQKILQINPINLNALQLMCSLCQSQQYIQKCLNALNVARTYHVAHHMNRINQLTCIMMIKQHKYKEMISQFKKSQNIQLLYYVALGYYKIQENLKASLILESCFTICDKPIKFIKLLLAIKIKQRNFYQAMHTLQRINHFNMNRAQLTVESKFINGVISMIRREARQGVDELKDIADLINEKNKKQGAEEGYQQISKIIYCFLAYGYYCLGSHQQCEASYRIQAEKYPEIIFESTDYNRKMNYALWLCTYSREQEAINYFKKACDINPNKLEPYLCLALTYFQIGYINSQKQIMEECRENFIKSFEHVSKQHANTASFAFFYKSIFHSYLEEWKDAIICIDEAIDRCQENYWKHFYVRALIFASLHNFSEAINDATIAINLKNKMPELYYLRASCFQIQGEGTHAFHDLQLYIALRPDDAKIHKFAGKLLFENGAFEDAIKAFDHEPIEEIIQNYDAFLTKCKTYFLLGQFNAAADQMMRLYKLFNDHQHLKFDSMMMEIIRDIIDPDINREQVIRKLQKHFQENYDTSDKNCIFKETQLHTFKATCYFQLNQIDNALKQFELAIKAKQKIIVRQTLIEGGNREDERDTRLYLSQMRFNICLCYLKLGNLEKAEQVVKKMEIGKNQNFYENYKKFKEILNQISPQPISKQQEILKLEVFPTKNKISHYLPDQHIQTKQKVFYFKLCIPYPKVEPPEIFPVFDTNIFKQLTPELVEKKPEAPWIIKEMNSINFTGKIERYSRLELEESVVDTSVQQFEADSSHISLQSLSSRRMEVNAADFRNHTKSRKMR